MNNYSTTTRQQRVARRAPQQTSPGVGQPEARIQPFPNATPNMRAPITGSNPALGAAPGASAMSRAQQFFGSAPAQIGPGPGTGFPAGMDFTNMAAFARTPAGQALLQRIMQQIRSPILGQVLGNFMQ